MKGDFSRIRFNPAKQYTSVLKQQGRVDLDADANEQRFIDEATREAVNVDVIGRCGGPENDAGFEITVKNNGGIVIGKGRYYVDGILVENQRAMNYDDQPFLLGATSASDLLDQLMNSSNDASLSFVLEVWQRLVTGLDDPCLLEPALGQADTTARLQTVWRVIGTLNDPSTNFDSTTGIVEKAGGQPIYTTGIYRKEIAYGKVSHAGGQSYGPVTSGSTGSAGTGTETVSETGIIIKLPDVGGSGAGLELSPCCQSLYQQGRWRIEKIKGEMGASVASSGNDCGCQPIAAAGYQGQENQLYRVEIHQSGDLSSATFKWSRENASVVTAVTYIGANSPTVTVSSIGPDANLGFQAGQWVELTDDTYQFGETPNQPGPLFQIQSVNPTTQQVTMTTPVFGIDVSKRARMRRWDQIGASASSNGIPISSASISLENGIEVDFRGEYFQAGDYWTFAARTASGQIDWPPCGDSSKHFQSPSGIEIHRAPLACVRIVNDYTLSQSKKYTGVKQEGRFTVNDCRLFFPPLTSLSASAAATALHVKSITWKNDDVMTVDTFMQNGLAVTFDQATTCAWSGGNFQVTLEPPLLASAYRAFDEAQFASFKSMASSADPGTDVFLRTVMALDPPMGISVSGNTVTWLAAITTATGQNYSADAVWFFLNILLGAASPHGYGRVRVRLIGGAVYGSGLHGNIYLDGESLGSNTTRTLGDPAIGYALPSGTSSKASDYEGWFYLAPTVLVTNVVIQGVNNGIETTVKALKVVVNSNNQITSLQIGETATVTNLQAAITLSYPPVQDTVVSLMFTGTGVGTVVSIASSITIPAGQTTATTPIQVLSNPGGGVTDVVTLVASVSTAVMNKSSDVQPQLSIAGMTPPVNWK